MSKVRKVIYRRCIIDTFECLVTRFRLNTICRTRLTVVNALTSKYFDWTDDKVDKPVFNENSAIRVHSRDRETERNIFKIARIYTSNLKLRAKTFLLNRFKKSLGIRVLTWFAFLGLQNCISLHRFFTVGYWASVTLCR